MVIAHFADQVHQEQQRAVGNTWQARAKATVKAFLRMFVVNLALNLFPVHAKRRIREHVVELVQRQLVVRESVTQLNTTDVLAFDQHIGFTDCVGFRVQLLTKGAHHRVRVQFVHIFHARREESAGPGGRVINGADDTGLRQGFIIFHKYQRSGQTHDIARGEVLTGGLVRAFRETADKLLEHQAHFIVGNRFRAQISGGEFLHHFKQQVGIFQQADKLAEFEVLEDFTRIR